LTVLTAVRVLVVFTAYFTARSPLGTAAEPEVGARRDKNPDAVVQEAEDFSRVWKVTGAIDSLAWSPDSVTLAIQTKPVNHLNPDASDRSCKIQLWNVNEARLERVLYEQDDSTGAIFSVEFSPDGKSLACAAWPTARLRGETRA